MQLKKGVKLKAFREKIECRRDAKYESYLVGPQPLLLVISLAVDI
jgi:hypothetical protein